MSYAVIQTGGKQYKVKAGEILKVEKLQESKPSSTVDFKEILAYGDDGNIEVVFGSKSNFLYILNDFLSNILYQCLLNNN